MSKSPKTTAKLSKRAETSVVLFFMVFSVTSALILQPFLTVDHLNQESLKTISWSVNAT